MKESKLAEEDPDCGCGSWAEMFCLPQRSVCSPRLHVPRVRRTAGVGGAKGLPTSSLKQSAQGMEVDVSSKMGQIFLIQLQQHSL